jgi:predicted PurR-regulated permease PerM
MHLVDGFILQPYIFSNSVMAHPLEIFLVILLGADIAGVGGMVLAIPAYTVLRVIAKVFFNEFRFVQLLTENLEQDDN